MDRLGLLGFLRAMLSSDKAVSFGRVSALFILVTFQPVYLYVFLSWRWDGLTLVYFALIGVLLFLAALMPSKITDAMRAFAERGNGTKAPQAPEDKAQ